MKKVLIISPHFPPVNAPDHQRVRLALPYFNQLGWEAHVLCIDPAHIKKEQDAELEAALPAVNTTKVPLPFNAFFRLLRTDAFGWRSWLPLRAAGSRLLEHGQFDLIYFSTTIFLCFSLGPYWKKRFHIPFVIDIQDPWHSSYYKDNPNIKPPGGKLKYTVANMLAGYLEPKVLSQCAGITSVSPAYLDSFAHKYPRISIENQSTIPFGASRLDFEHANHEHIQNPAFNATNDIAHWSYLGRGGADLEFSVQAFCTALNDIQADNRPNVNCIGTSYEQGALAKPSIKPLAAQVRAESLIHERAERIPYFSALRAMQESNVNIIFGSNDPGYNASKIANLILAGKPILAILHKESPALRILAQCPFAHVVGFTSDSSFNEVCKELKPIMEKLIAADPESLPIDDELYALISAESQTQQLVEVFEKALA